jgi:CheY-like chemotaxis protein
MPILTGDLATKQLREAGLRVPIVGVTGDAHAEDLQTFLASGANEVTCRPPSPPAGAHLHRGASRCSPSPCFEHNYKR